MFQNISWQSYWTVVALFSAGYYLVIYLLYFRKDFSITFPNNRVADNGIFNKTEHPSLFDAETEALDKVDHKDNEEKLAKACLDELTAFFDAQQKTRGVKSELLYGLHHIVQKYPSLLNSPYKETLSNVMYTQAENGCSIHLSADEMKQVWLVE